MASAFDVQFTSGESPEEAQARAATQLTEPARKVGLRLTKRAPGELVYRPRVQFPFLVMLYHVLAGEQMTVHFEPDPGGGARVSISGRVARSKLPLASDPEHWTDALGDVAGR